VGSRGDTVLSGLPTDTGHPRQHSDGTLRPPGSRASPWRSAASATRACLTACEDCSWRRLVAHGAHRGRGEPGWKASRASCRDANGSKTARCFTAPTHSCPGCPPARTSRSSCCSPTASAASRSSNATAPPPPGSDHLTSYPAWLAVQNGQPTDATARFDPTPRFIRNGRDLGEWSHRDFSYQGPLVACVILLDCVARDGRHVLAEAYPCRDHPTPTCLRKVFTRLGVSSRRQLDRILPGDPTTVRPRQPRGQAASRFLCC
jgi:hypothetical protein